MFVDYIGVCAFAWTDLSVEQSCVRYSAVDSNWSPTDNGYLRHLAIIVMKTSEIVADVTAEN